MALSGLIPQLSNLGQTVTQSEKAFVATADTITNAVTAPNGLKIPASQVATGLSGGITSIAPTGTLSSALKGISSLGSASGASGILNSAIGTAQTLAGATQSVVGAAAALGLNVNALGQITQSILGLSVSGGANPSFALTPQFSFALTSPDVLSYPLDLPVDASGVRLGLYFKKYQRDTAVQVADYAPSNAIYLPVPDSLIERHNPKWATIDPGPLRAGVTKGFTDAISQSNDYSANSFAMGALGAVDNFASSIAGQLTKTALGGNFVNEVGAGIAGGLSEILGDKNTGLAQNYFGLALNPASTAMFKGVALRTHTFSWTFAPRSKEESAQLQKILDTIRSNILPTVTADKFFLGYPSVCFPRFEPQSTALYDFKPCVVTDVQINHAGGGEPSFFYDTYNPTIISLVISLQEIEMKVNGDANILSNANASPSTQGSLLSAASGSTPSNDDELNALPTYIKQPQVVQQFLSGSASYLTPTLLGH
jgi:hypothetical protein